MQHMTVAQNPYSISKRMGKTSQAISDNKFMTYGTQIEDFDALNAKEPVS
jgi:hypothetical protein